MKAGKKTYINKCKEIFEEMGYKETSMQHKRGMTTEQCAYMINPTLRIEANYEMLGGKHKFSIDIDGDPFDVSGFHAGHDGLIGDNEYYEEDYGEVTHRKATKEEVIAISGGEDTEYLMDYLVVNG